ncbi:MAG: STAS domain-containing protein [Nitrospira sp.]
MDVQEETNGSVCQLRIAGEMTIYTALELKPRLLGSLAQCDRLEVQVSDVTEVDTAGLQLLLLAKREASSAGKQVQVLAPSPAMQEAMQQFYLNANLESL